MSAMQIFTAVFGMVAAGGWGYFCGYNQGRIDEIFKRATKEV